MNRQTEYFTVSGLDGLIAFRPAGRRHVVQFGDVFAAPDQRDELLKSFVQFAAARRRRIVTVQLGASDAELYSRRGFTVNQLGASYARSLDGFSLSGKRFVQLRNKISRAKRAGIVVDEVGNGGSPGDGLEGLAAIDRKWLHSKGRHVKELAFMVGELGGPAGHLRRLFVASNEAGEVVAYVSFAPVYGTRSGWLHDLSRRDPDAPPGVLELVVVTAVDRFRSEGAPYLHFGFTPFTSLDAGHEVPGHSPLVSRAVRLLAERGSAMYPAATQLAYKEKWGLDLIQPEYIAFQGRMTPGRSVESAAADELDLTDDAVLRRLNRRLPSTVGHGGAAG